MSESDLEFVIFRDMRGAYRWRLRSAAGETVELSERRHHKGECEQDVYSLIGDRYPDARVRDATVG